MITIINLAMPFFGLIVLGLIASRVFGKPGQDLYWLNIFVVYFALTALIFRTIAAAPFEQLIAWPFFTATTLATYLAFIIPLGVSMLVLGTGISRAAIQGMAASYGNIGYMGLPLAVAFFGSEAVVPAVLIFCFDNILQFTLTPMLVALGHSRARQLSAGRLSVHVVWSIITHPFIVATLLGGIASAVTFLRPELAASVLDMPGVAVIAQMLEILSRAAGPVALFALGVTVGMRRFAGIGTEFPMLVAFKLVVHPLLAYAMLTLVGGVDPLWLHVALMMAALPTAANVFVLASQYRTYIEGASSSILVSTLLSAFTIPVLIYAIKSGLIP
jgi:hypothetical protein